MRDLVFWSKNRFLRNKAFKAYQEAIKIDKLSRKEIELINGRKRLRLLSTVLKYSNFYKEFYKGLKLSENFIVDKAFWEDIPILEKHHIREYCDKIFCDNVAEKNYRQITTGGSTGVPLVSYRDRRFNEEILQWRMLKRWNVSPADNRLILWRETGEYKGKLARLKNQLIWFPTLRIREDVSVLSDDIMFKLFSHSNRIGVKVIWGYVGAVFQYASFLLEKNLVYDKPLNCIWVTAAPLSKNQRFIIEKAFKTEALDQYGCSEIHFIASGIRKSPDLVVEKDFRHLDLSREDDTLINEDDYGLLGDILITDLQNNVFPLIKYRVGDRTSYSNNRFGMLFGMPMIKPVKGRISDTLKIGNGSILSGEYLTTIFDDYVGVVESFQFVQKESNLIEINIVSRAENINEIMSYVISGLNKQLGNEVVFKWFLVDHINHDKGKIRYIISELDDEN